jgi:hypothetical protein
MAGRSNLTLLVVNLVLAASRRASGYDHITLTSKLSELGLSAAQSYYSAILRILSELDATASLPFTALAGAQTIGDIVKLIKIRIEVGAAKSAAKTDDGVDRSSHPKAKSTNISKSKACSPESISVKLPKRAATPQSETSSGSPARPRRNQITRQFATNISFPPSRSSDGGAPFPLPPRRGTQVKLDIAEILEAGSLASLDFGVSASSIAPPVTLTAESDTERQINIWIGDGADPLKRALAIGKTYTLNFKVGAPVAENLTSGPEATVRAGDVPPDGLKTDWLVVAHDAELTAGTTETKAIEQSVQKIQTWSGRFSLLIPEVGDSAVPQLKFKPLKTNPSLDVIVTVRAELYRQFKLSLVASKNPDAESVDSVRIDGQHMPTPTEHMGLSTTHEWTTPNGTLGITVLGSQAAVRGDAGAEHVDSIEPWFGLQAKVSGPIRNARNAAEDLRVAWENHLNDIPSSDLAARLKNWRPNYWGSPGDDADDMHRRQWERMAKSAELRSLALQGQQLFRAFFPLASKLNGWIAKAFPGSRLDISWTELSGAGFIPHVPWGLMYVADVPPQGEPIDPMGFLGLRCRVAYTSHAAESAGRSLGDLDETHCSHFLYWGDGAADVTGQEARWQRANWSGWQNQIFIPQKLENAKAELLQQFNNPQPTPTSVLYLFCQCNTGDGNAPVLRFGGTNDVANMVSQTDFGTAALADRPLVFANACTTTAADPYMANELEEAFFNRQCRAYLGTETKVPIVFGSRFATIFFHFFYRQLDPEPMAAGEAAAQTRLFLWTHYRNIGGLFYCYVNQYDLFLARNDEVLAMRK